MIFLFAYRTTLNGNVFAKQTLGLVGHWEDICSIKNRLAYPLSMAYSRIPHRDTIDRKVDLLTNPNPFRDVNRPNVPFAVFKFRFALCRDKTSKQKVFIKAKLMKREIDNR